MAIINNTVKITKTKSLLKGLNFNANSLSIDHVYKGVNKFIIIEELIIDPK